MQEYYKRYYEALRTINELQDTVEHIEDRLSLFNEALATAKAKAVKEFAERVKARMLGYYECLDESAKGRPYKGDTLMDYEVVDMIEDCIDNIVKEMVGEQG